MAISSNSLSKWDEGMRNAIADALKSAPAQVDRLSQSKRLVFSIDTGSTWAVGHDKRAPKGNSETTGVLVTDFDDLMAWFHSARKHWRASGGFHPHSISYKKLREKNSRHLEAHHKFLNASDELKGLICTLTSLRESSFVFTTSRDVAEHPSLQRFRVWDPVAFERLLRLANLLSSLLAGVGTADQEIMLLCDQDDIIATPQMRFEATSMLSASATNATGREVIVTINTPSDMQDPLAAKDVLAIPDLAAGGIGEAIERTWEESGEVVGSLTPFPDEMRAKAMRTAIWFGQTDAALVKIALTLHPEDEPMFVHRHEVLLVRR